MTNFILERFKIKFPFVTVTLDLLKLTLAEQLKALQILSTQNLNFSR